MKCFRFTNVTNNTTAINTFNSDNSNITKIKTQQIEIMHMIKKPIVADNILFTVITFSHMNCFTYINSLVIWHL